MSWGYTVIIGITAVTSAVESDKARKLEREGQDKQAEASRRESAASRKIADIKATRERRKAVRESRKVSGTAIAQQESSGVSSTSVEGFTGSVRTQTASGIGAGETISAINTETSIFNIETSKQAQALFGEAGRHRTNAAYAETIGSVAKTFK